MIRSEGVPDGAEELDMSKFLKSYDLPSKILPGLTQRVWKLHCPQCSAQHMDPFKVNVCECGLSMKLDGNLYVWRAITLNETTGNN